MLELYHAPNSVALAPLIALEEAGAAYRPVAVNFAANEQRGAAYLAKNPKGRVPLLMTPEGPLTETIAILEYIGRKFPKAGLLPEDLFLMARMQEFNAWLASTVHVSHAHRMRGARWSDDAGVIEGLKAKVTANMTAHMRDIETRYLAGPWVLGDLWSAADAYLYVIWRWLPSDSVDLAEFPRLAAHARAMEARPATGRAVAIIAGKA